MVVLRPNSAALCAPETAVDTPTLACMTSREGDSVSAKLSASLLSRCSLRASGVGREGGCGSWSWGQREEMTRRRNHVRMSAQCMRSVINSCPCDGVKKKARCNVTMPVECRHFVISACPCGGV